MPTKSSDDPITQSYPEYRGSSQAGVTLKMKWVYFAVPFLLAMGVAVSSPAQPGSLKGKTLSGAGVFLIGTFSGATTNLDGNYVVMNISAGTYNVRVSLEGFSTKVLADITIPPGGQKELDVRLEPQAADDGRGTYTIDDVIITAERVLSTDAAVLVARMKSSTIGDGISAEQIARSPDATSGDALKRVTGLSVVDDKYVFVRGVTDRYNATTLNGVSVTSTSTDADKKSFAFDLIPASLMSNSVVIKTASPDLPGDFSGGLVRVNTLEFPEHRVIDVSYGSTYTTNTTGKEIRVGASGSTDWKGKDDGSRSLPSNLEGNDLVKALPNNWGTNTDTARPSGKYAVSYGDRLKRWGQELGFIGSLTYSAGNETYDFRQEPKRQGDLPYFINDGTRYNWDVLWGGLLNVSYRPLPRHKIGLKNTYNRSANEYVSVAEGENENAVPIKRQTIQWDERNVFVRQVNGAHTFGLLDGLDFEWQYTSTKSGAKEPDRKHIEYGESPTKPGTYVMKENYRTWSELEEKSGSYSADLTLEWRSKKFKTGFSYYERERQYHVDAFFAELPSYRPGRVPAWDFLLLPVDEIFDPRHFGAKVDSTAWGWLYGFDFKPQTVFTGEYDGSALLRSYYAMADVPFYVLGESFRLTGGARVENSNQTVHTLNADSKEPIPSSIDTLDVLPSVNLTYHFSEAVNVRLAYYKSVNRPEFREMSDVTYYDFNNSELVIGEPNLNRAVIKNYDARVEWFPTPGEVVAVSYFHKNLTDAIEEKLVPSPERYVRTWFNSPEGKNYGYELELRKRLGFFEKLSGHLDFMNNFTVFGNYTKVNSEVAISEKKTKVVGDSTSIVTINDTRPLQGQAPWLVNLGFQFYYPRYGSSVSLLFNKIGRRLHAVGETREDDIYEEPRNQLDLALTQAIGRVRAKFTIKNMLRENLELTSGESKALHTRRTNSTKYALSLSFNL